MFRMTGSRGLGALALVFVSSLWGCQDGGGEDGKKKGMGGGPTLAGRVIPSAQSRSEASGVPPELLEVAREALAKGDLSAQSAPNATPVRPPVDPGIDPAPQPPAFVHGELLVKLRGDLGDALAGLREALPAYRFEAGAWAAPKILTLRFHRAEAPTEPVGAEETRSVQARVAALDLFAYVELNYIRKAHAKPNDEHYEFAWHYPQIHMEIAWELSTGSDQVVIAVIDDGVAPHEDLSRLLPGYDFVSDPMAAGDGDGRDADPSPVGAGMQPIFHGQHVAGTIGADADNGKGIPGMDWRARILPVRVLGTQGGTSADVIAGIYWAVGAEVPGAPANPNPAQVLNLSLGGGPLIAAEQEAIDAARAAGAILVVAAGNENVDASRQSLAGYDGVIVVGAIDYMGNRAFYSNFGPVVDVMAPGGDTSVDKNADGYEDGVLSLWFEGGGPSYKFLQGTSMAAPHVAGLLGLMKALQPNLGADEAERILKETADPNYRCTEGCGAGLINPVRALQAVGGKGGDTPLLSVPVSRVDIGSQEKASLQLANVGGAPLDWTAKVGGPEKARIALADEAGTIEAGGSFALGIQVDRSGLPDGSYQATLELSAPSGKHTVALLFTVGEVEVVDVGTVQILTVRYDYAGELEAGGEASTDAARGYRFSVSTEPGPWFLVAMVDADGDGVLAGSDLLGFWPNNSQPKLVELGAGETRADMDFVLEPVGVEEVKEPACAEVRRCWEACGWERPCVDRCPVSEACSNCFSQVVDPCLARTSCEDCCTDCGAEYDTCFGPQFCADVDEGEGGAGGAGGGGGGDPGAGGTGGGGEAPGGAGFPCTKDDDCAYPYICDTEVPGGYCSSYCFSQEECPGAVCADLLELGVGVCLAICDGEAPCPRPGDTCVPLDLGGGACWPPT